MNDAVTVVHTRRPVLLMLEAIEFLQTIPTAAAEKLDIGEGLRLVIPITAAAHPHFFAVRAPGIAASTRIARRPEEAHSFIRSERGDEVTTDKCRRLRPM